MLYEITILGEKRYPVIEVVSNIQLAIFVTSNPVWEFELTVTTAIAPELTNQLERRIKYLQAVIGRIGDYVMPLWREADIPRFGERLGPFVRV